MQTPVSEDRVANSPAGRINIGYLELTCLCILPSLILAIVGIIYFNHKLKDELALRPRVVVVDTLDWIRNAGVGDTNADRYKDGLKRLNHNLAELRAKGILVVDSMAVKAAPDNIVIHTPRPDPVGETSSEGSSTQ